MAAIIKWTIRAYLATKILKTAAHATTRTPQENIQAAFDSVHDTKESIMKLTGSPGASLNPSRQSARNHARQTVPVVRSATTALLGAAGTDALRIGQWKITEDPDGNLVAEGNDGRTCNLTINADGPEPITDPAERTEGDIRFTPPPAPPGSSW